MIAEMQQDELRLAIEQPAAHHGVVLETGLVEEIIKDVQGQAGYLPLLQYTLNLLWSQESQRSAFAQERSLRTQTYRNLGGVRGAFQKHVDQIYGALTEPERVAAQRIFLKLVEIGGDEESGTEWKPVRRRAVRSEFQDATEERVLTRLINENLLVSDRQPQAEESTIEIAHEILLTSWEMLSTWIKENRQAIALRNRLNDDVMRWQTQKREDELWTGSKLEQVLELRKDLTFNQVLGGFSSAANQFIDASSGLSDRIRKRQIRQARTIAGVSIGAAVLVGIAGVVAMIQRQEAVRQRIQADQQTQIALARQLIAQAEVAKNQGETQLQHSMLLAIEGVHRLNALGVPSAEGDAILRYGLSLLPPLVSSGNQQTYTDVTAALSSNESSVSRQTKYEKCKGKFYIHDCISPNGKYIAHLLNFAGASGRANSVDFVVVIKDAVDKRTLAILPNNDYVRFLAFSLDGRYISTNVGKEATDAGKTQIWDLASQRNSILFNKDVSLASLAFSNDGKNLHTLNSNQFGSSDFLQSFELATGKNIRNIRLGSPDAELSSDGRFTTTLVNKMLQVIKVDTERVIMSFPESSAAFSHDGKYIAILNNNDILQIQEIEPGQVIFQQSFKDLIDASVVSNDLPGSLGSIADMDADAKNRFFRGFIHNGFAVNGKEIYFLNENGWIAATWNLLKNRVTISPNLSRTTGAILSSHGKYSATSNRYNIIQISENISGRVVSRIQNDGQGGDFAFSPDERHLAIVSWGNTIRIFEISTGREIYRLEDIINVKDDGSINKIAFSSDGKHLATYFYNDERSSGVSVWSLQTQDLIAPLCSRLTRNLLYSEWKQQLGEKPYQKTCLNLPFPKDLPENSSAIEPDKPNKPLDLTATSGVSQPPPTSAETTPSSTVSQSPSTSTSAYTFEFPQDSCGDKSALPDALWYPVFIDDKSVEEVSNQYCRDAQSVANREKTGKPSVQVASFNDRNKAQAFAERVGGEVGQPHKLQ